MKRRLTTWVFRAQDGEFGRFQSPGLAGRGRGLRERDLSGLASGRCRDGTEPGIWHKGVFHVNETGRASLAIRARRMRA